MRLFRRESTGPDANAIPAFWSWWSAAADRVASAITSGDPGSMVDEISAAVRAVDGRLAWEVAPGSTSKHALVVTPEGDPALRPVALRLMAAAPEADTTWEYHASRQAGSLGTLEMDGDAVDLARYRGVAEWDDMRLRAHVRLWHPTLEGRPEKLRYHFGFLFLDALMGEDDVERWIGEIDAVAEPVDGLPPEDLRADILRHAGAAASGEWLLVRRSDGALIAVDPAAKPIDHPFASTRITATFAVGMEDMAGSDLLADIQAAEDRLIESLGPTGVVELGHITERRRRSKFLMCEDIDGARTIADAWTKSESRLRPKVEVRDDPGWTVRGELGQ